MTQDLRGRSWGCKEQGKRGDSHLGEGMGQWRLMGPERGSPGQELGVQAAGEGEGPEPGRGHSGPDTAGAGTGWR